MKNRIQPLILAVNTIGIVVLIVLLMNGSANDSNTGYVDVSKVYAEFNLTKELDARYTAVSTRRQELLDSMRLDLEVLVKKYEAEQSQEVLQHIRSREQEYVQKEAHFQEDNASLSSRYNDQIMTQLNQYIKDFGDERKLDYIYGADGSGNLLYADQGFDYTEDALAYINEKFQGE